MKCYCVTQDDRFAFEHIYKTWKYLWWLVATQIHRYVLLLYTLTLKQQLFLTEMFPLLLLLFSISRWGSATQIGCHSSWLKWIQWAAAKRSEWKWKVYTVHSSFTRANWHYSITTRSKRIWKHAQSLMHHLQKDGSTSGSSSTHQELQEGEYRYVQHFWGCMLNLWVLDFEYNLLWVKQWSYSLLFCALLLGSLHPGPFATSVPRKPGRAGEISLCMYLYINQHCYSSIKCSVIIFRLLSVLWAEVHSTLM